MSDSNRPDSFATGLATAANSSRGRLLLKATVPYVATFLMGWAGSKFDSKVELQQAIALRAEDEAKEKRAIERHNEVMHSFEAFKAELFDTEQAKPGRVTRIERDQYWAWRALTEVKAAAYGGETNSMQARKERIGAKFAHSFDVETQEQTARVAYDHIFRAAHIE
jgi:hypothetical protein